MSYARRSMRRLVCGSLASLGLVSCGGWGSGSAWIKEPLVAEEERPSTMQTTTGARPPYARPSSRTLGPRANDERREGPGEPPRPDVGGRVLGTFRNTYYDFPRESDFAGESVSLMNASCKPIASVPRGFYDAVCVQGSGSLARGSTVSFAKRDCTCAEVCPRTGQRICFEALDANTFPWGRGATGKPITPFRTIAADSAVLPIGTVVYVPELDGVPRDDRGATIDGCFIVEDRGLRVRGEHIDIFTGGTAQTELLNRRVPSNQGVTIVVDTPRCTHLATR